MRCVEALTPRSKKVKLRTRVAGSTSSARGAVVPGSGRAS